MNALRARSLRWNRAFTLLELLVSVVIVVMIAAALMTLTDATSKLFNRTTGRIDQFHSARSAFEAMTRRLSQATLNTYVDYDDATAPKAYVRRSELRFIAGKTVDLLGASTAAQRPGHGIFFQAPLGYVSDPTNERLRNLLNTWGYFVEFGDDNASRPPFFASLTNAPPLSYRYRLMELMEPTESLGIYFYTSGFDSNGKPRSLTYMGREWFTTSTLQSSPTRPVRPIAENILALVVLPKLTAGEDPSGAKLSPNYAYDSSKTDAANSPSVPDANLNWKHQLPPVVQVTMIAADEASYKRFQAGSAPTDLLGSRFAKVGDLSNPALNTYSQDLDSLEASLRTNYRLNIRIFSTDVAIRAAKWSRDQKN
jgi:uncharacterized protein (TIGR02599 family)